MKQPEESAAASALYQKGMAEDVEDHHNRVGAVAGRGHFGCGRSARGSEVCESPASSAPACLLFEAGEAVDFNVTLQAERGDPPAHVLLHLLDANGVIVARRDVTLEPGKSATLRYRLPGVLRAQAQLVEPDAPLGSTSLLISTIEIFSGGDPKSLDPGLDATGRRRFVCSSDDPSGPGRIPDSD